MNKIVMSLGTLLCAGGIMIGAGQAGGGLLSKFRFSTDAASLLTAEAPSGIATPSNGHSLKRLASMLQAPATRLGVYSPEGVRRVAPTDFGDFNLMGAITYFEYDPVNDGVKGMYGINPSDENTFTLVREGVYPTGGGWEADGKYYSIEYREDDSGNILVSFATYDSQTWEQLSYEQNAGTPAQVASDITYDATTGLAYGCFNDDENLGSVFGYIEPANGWKRTAITDSRRYAVMAASPEGVIYAIDADGNLYTIDKTDGNETLIGSTGLEPYFDSSATFDLESGKLYYAICAKGEYKHNIFMQWGGTDGKLYEVDPATAKATLVADFDRNQEVMGMYSPAPRAAAAAPAAPADMNFDFSGNDHEGVLTFTMPSTTASGDVLEGDVTYTLTDNLTEKATGTAKAGDSVSLDLTFEQSGNHNLTLQLANEAGKSAKRTLYITTGTATIISPASQVAQEGRAVTISWDDITETANHGYLDRSKLTYLVKRQPDNTILVNGLDADTRSFSDTLPENSSIHRYYYEVWVRYDGSWVNPKTITDPVFAGTLSLPFTDDFQNYSKREEYTSIDANQDKKWLWMYDYSYRSMISANSGFSPNDDWLITPPVHFEKGKAYRVVANLESSEGRAVAPKMEVKLGTAAKAGAMIMAAVEPFEILNGEPEDYEWFLSVEETGEYFIGFHDISPTDAHTIMFHNLTIDAPIDGSAPDRVTNLAASRYADGSLKTDITFNAPTTDLTGRPLDKIDRIEVKRSWQTIATFTDVEPGAALSTTATASWAGEYTYTVTPYNASGAGRKAEVTVFIGKRPPMPVTVTHIVETDNPGEVCISWEAPTEDINGDPLEPEDLTYDVVPMFGMSTYPVASDIEETTFTYQAVEADKQDLVQFAIYARTEGGASETSCYTEAIPVGAPYELPYAESFADKTTKYITAVSSADGLTMWYGIGDDAFSDVQSYDGDNGFLMMRGSYAGGSATVSSGKIALGDMENPSLTFQLFNLDGSQPDINTLTVYIREKGGDWKPVQTIINCDLPQGGWNKVTVPLAAFAGKEIQYAFKGILDRYQTIFVDDIRIEQQIAANLAIDHVNMPASVKPGEEFGITVHVANTGVATLAADDWRVTLYEGEQPLATVPGKKVAYNQVAAVRMNHIRDFSSAEEVNLTVRIECAADLVADDNTSDHRLFVEYPIVVPATGLEATTDGAGGVRLAWNEPDLSTAAPAERLETFDSYEPWLYEDFGGWTLFDGDGATIGGINGIDFPNVPDLGQGACSWYIMDSNFDYGDFQWYFTAHSGSNLLGMMYNASGKADDWIISPELYGGRQVISFYAKCLGATMPEQIEVLAAESNQTDTAAFASLDVITLASTDWQKFTVVLPEGSSRFALRCITAGGFMAFLDDIEFIPAGEPRQLSLLGYNVYRNRVKINEVPVKETAFADHGYSTGDSYYVTAVYTDGESRASNVVSPLYSAIDGIDADGTVTVKATAGQIIIEGADGLMAEVYTVDGIRLHSTLCAGRTTIDAAAGLYVVKAGTIIRKVIVR